MIEYLVGDKVIFSSVADGKSIAGRILIVNRYPEYIDYDIIAISDKDQILYKHIPEKQIQRLIKNS